MFSPSVVRILHNDYIYSMLRYTYQHWMQMQWCKDTIHDFVHLHRATYLHKWMISTTLINAITLWVHALDALNVLDGHCLHLLSVHKQHNALSCHQF